MPLRFAPLRLPLRRRLQTAAVLQWVCTFLGLGQLCVLLFVLALRGSLWLPALLYAGWLWADRDTPNRGGRRSAWVRSWPVWNYFRDYFPISLVKTADLDPRRNYVFGCHPHGVLAAGAFANFCTEATAFGAKFPGLRPHVLTLPCWFRLPLLREAGVVVPLQPAVPAEPAGGRPRGRDRAGGPPRGAGRAARRLHHEGFGAQGLRQDRAGARGVAGARVQFWGERAVPAGCPPPRLGAAAPPAAAPAPFRGHVPPVPRPGGVPVRLRAPPLPAPHSHGG
ncbi:2-acylglycerol O-acyltransferase 2-B-like isoform X4 [Columba livia]|uniref:2-acylglycerol O-acyltransferase 2-B-like isoform X4 n=1 Tax=Columba livia TaxID=8932 RepID=UPI0031B9B032